MAPEYDMGMDTLFKVDSKCLRLFSWLQSNGIAQYSCGLLFWYIMRSELELWDNELLGPVKKSNGDGMIALACASMQQDNSISPNELAKAGDILNTLLRNDPEKRRLHFNESEESLHQ